MPSRKQRRRREKLQRHEYEWVVETEGGEEVPLDHPAERPKKDEKSNGRKGVRNRHGREIPKPTLGRVLRRTAIFGPLILVVVFLTGSKDATTAGKVYTAVILLAFFIPFSYLVDVFLYRTLLRRQERARRD
jgi:hypothetical protein